MSKRTKQWMLVGAGMLVLVALLIRSFRHNPEWKAFRWSLFLDSLVSVDKLWTVWALVAIYATYVVRALRWKVLMREIKPNAGFWNLFSATMIGFAAIGLFGRAGE